MAGQTYKNPARWFSGGATRMAWGRYTRTTFVAWSPLSPCFTSNSTTCPSASVLKPSIWIDEKCTNTSSPPSCSMKPYPLASLNHFTFPLITIRLLQSLFFRPNVDGLEKTRAPEDCQAGFLRFVQCAVQLAIPQQAAHIAARLGVRDQFDEPIRVCCAGAIE